VLPARGLFAAARDCAELRHAALCCKFFRKSFVDADYQGCGFFLTELLRLMAMQLQ